MRSQLRLSASNTSPAFGRSREAIPKDVQHLTTGGVRLLRRIRAGYFRDADGAAAAAPPATGLLPLAVELLDE